MWFIIEKIIAIFSIMKMFYWFSALGVFKSYLQIKTFDRGTTNWALEASKYLGIKIKRIPSKF